MDLPITSSLAEHRVQHYTMYLQLDMEARQLKGWVVLHLLHMRKEDDGMFHLALDCSELSVQCVEEVEEEHGQFQALKVLPHTTGPWALTIRAQGPGPSPGLLRVTYCTQPSSPSLLWRTDSAGQPCVHTAAAGVNNRALLPCQDQPRGLATWSLTLSLPLQLHQPPYTVYCTGDREATVYEEEQCQVWRSSTSRLLPISAFALAVGRWTPLSLGPNLRLATPSLNTNALLGRYLRAALKAASSLLGHPHPEPRLDLVVVHRSFSGLGLCSPALIFLSPSLLAGDPALLIKLAHEVTHAWFGLTIGAEDWAEQWLSEGFATFLEDYIHDLVLEELGLPRHRQLVKLRAITRFLQLEEEVSCSRSELQELSSASREGSVRHGLDPLAGLGQLHYSKGFFLLHHLQEACGGSHNFLPLLSNYIEQFSGQLVNSQHFLQLYFSTFPQLRNQEEDRVQSWLLDPGLPNRLD